MDDSVGAAESAKIDQQDGVTALREITARKFVRRTDQVVLVIRVKAEQRGKCAVGIGTIEIRRQRRAVAKWNQKIALDFDLIFHLSRLRFLRQCAFVSAELRSCASNDQANCARV